MARWCGASGIVVLIASVLWFVFAGGVDPVGVPDEQTSGDGIGGRSTPDAPQGPRGSGAAEAARVLVDAPLLTLPPLPEDTEWVEVIVIDEATGAPVPGAEVTWFDRRSRALVRRLPFEERYRFLGSWDRYERATVGVVVTNAEGCVRVPIVGLGTMVHASRGDLRGELECQRGDPSGRAFHRLFLRRTEVVVLEVRRHDGGQAQAARVLVHSAALSGSAGREELVTDHEGLAEFDLLSLIEGLSPEDRELARGSEWHVEAPAIGAEPDAVTFRFDPPPERRIVLQLPPAGRLRLRAVCEGVACSPLWPLGLSPATPVGSVAVSPNLVGADGWQEFYPVPLGRSFRVTAGGPAHGSDWQAIVEGPRRDGELVSVDLEVDAWRMLLTGQVVDESGTPLARAELRCQVRQGFPGMSSYSPQPITDATITLDASGRFRLWCDVVDLVGRLGLWLECAQPDGLPMRGLAQIDPLQSRRHDFGEIRLRKTPHLASGRFVCEAGAVPDVVHFVVQHRAPGPSSEWNGWRASRQAFPDGRFVVHGEPVEGAYRLVVQDWRCSPQAPVAFEPGATDLEVEVERVRGLTARVRLPDEAGPFDLSLRLEPRDPELRARLRAADDVSDLGRRSGRATMSGAGAASYQWTALPPGLYDLRVFAPCFDDPVAEVPAVQVPGPEEGDPRLAAIDLREVVVSTRFDLRFDWQDHEPFEDEPWGMVLRWPLDPGRECIGWNIDQDFGQTSLVPKGSYAVLVGCEGWKPVRATMVDGLVRATLRRWPEVVLRFPEHVSLPEGWSFAASLRAHEVLPRWQAEGDFDLAGSSGFSLRGVLLPDLDAVDAFDGSARVILGNGPHALEVALSDEGGNSVQLKDVSPATIYAANGDVTVRLSEDELAAAIERLRR